MLECYLASTRNPRELCISFIIIIVTNNGQLHAAQVQRGGNCSQIWDIPERGSLSIVHYCRRWKADRFSRAHELSATAVLLS